MTQEWFRYEWKVYGNKYLIKTSNYCKYYRCVEDGCGATSRVCSRFKQFGKFIEDQVTIFYDVPHNHSQRSNLSEKKRKVRNKKEKKKEEEQKQETQGEKKEFDLSFLDQDIFPNYSSMMFDVYPPLSLLPTK
jgi:hypothetical protein